jgi:hypothetical protein
MNSLRRCGINRTWGDGVLATIAGRPRPPGHSWLLVLIAVWHERGCDESLGAAELT